MRVALHSSNSLFSSQIHVYLIAVKVFGTTIYNLSISFFSYYFEYYLVGRTRTRTRTHMCKELIACDFCKLETASVPLLPFSYILFFQLFKFNIYNK